MLTGYIWFGLVLIVFGLFTFALWAVGDHGDDDY
jgi:hypothetical protein